MKSINTKVDVDDLMIHNRNQKCRNPRPPAVTSGRSKLASMFFNMFGISSNNNDAVANKRSATPETHQSTKQNGSERVVMSPVLRYPNKAISDAAAAAAEKKSTSKFLSVLWKKQVAAAMKARLLRRIPAKGRADNKKECNDEIELCKRRILMGMKCRPINKSGKLHYGQDGTIVAED